MIVPEWKRILLGEEKFEDPEVEVLANAIMAKIKDAANAGDRSTVIELYNDLEQLMGRGEWLARKYKRITTMLSEPLTTEDRQVLQEKQLRVKELRDKVVRELAKKYNVSLKKL